MVAALAQRHYRRVANWCYWVLFRQALVVADQLRYDLIIAMHGVPVWGILAPLSLGALGAGAAVYFVDKFAPETSGSGIPRVEAVLRSYTAPANLFILPVKFFGGLLAIGSGLALGREGPTVQMGATIGRYVGGDATESMPDAISLMAAGAGAGITVAFNAPFAGIIFVIEELVHRFSVRIMYATLTACIVAVLVTRALLGQPPIFQVAQYPYQPFASLPIYILLGLALGILGIVFNRMLLYTLKLFDRGRGWPLGARGAFVGVAVALVAWQIPNLVGGGDNIAQDMVRGVGALNMLPLFFLIRFILTMISYGSGEPGGIFAPLLALGTQFGLLIGGLGHAWFPGTIPDPTAFAIVGMAAYFVATIRSPLTGVALVLEMTGSFTLILPMLVASASAYGIVEWLHDEPIYEALRERDAQIENRRRYLDRMRRGKKR